MSVTLTTLSENTAGRPDFMAEWGQSILVQTDGCTVLFDVGGSNVALANADRLGIDLTKIDAIVLSHGHHDHTGGLLDVLKRLGKTRVIGHPAIWDIKYAKRPQEDKEAFIGIPFAREKLENIGASFELTPDPVSLSGRMMTTGEVEMTTDFEIIERNLLLKEGGKFIQDPLADDLALIVRMDEGLLVILGCAHRGAINTIRHAQKLTGEARVYAVVGGTHLAPASEERIERTIEELKDIGVQKVGISHCNGFYASVRIAQAFGDKFFLNNAGTRITLP
ncbi:MAG TPA: MBL fold metallo-hydrolase [Syntrophorhabdaceae bacterium]|nr:MBL fold metallo-hydrolase [Syntrophorhabdaceae bacterium]HQM81110.1 MBL fold metallo-hydrolase [Syntrophorhabdaceae bacterium]